MVIGHEMTHGFDDQGRQFDKDGNMNNWWTDEDAAAFKAKTEKLVEQFDAVEVLPALRAAPPDDTMYLASVNASAMSEVKVMLAPSNPQWNSSSATPSSAGANGS